MTHFRSPPNFCNHRFCLLGSEVSISRLRNESAERLKISFLDLGADIRSTDCTVVACLSRNDRAGETGLFKFFFHHLIIDSGNLAEWLLTDKTISDAECRSNSCKDLDIQPCMGADDGI